MSLVSLVITLIVVGVLLWLINNYIPMDGKIKRILNMTVVVVVVLWILNAMGLIDSIRGIRVGR
jgi:UDP-N-acetylmuramyl pentapeptide phosphotransferase/UDP-N-acetylglucosamine-1-phosphate transferase